jgi:hypothetical protein
MTIVSSIISQGMVLIIMMSFIMKLRLMILDMLPVEINKIENEEGMISFRRVNLDKIEVCRN